MKIFISQLLKNQLAFFLGTIVGKKNVTFHLMNYLKRNNNYPLSKNLKNGKNNNVVISPVHPI